VSTLYTGFALLSILVHPVERPGRDRGAPSAVQDVAKLQFALSIMWMYFFWSQYLVIWYGNVPVETKFFLQRLFVEPWRTLAWVILVVGWLVPFRLPPEAAHRAPAGTARTAARRRGCSGWWRSSSSVCFVVFPSVSPAAVPPLPHAIFIHAGFLALFVLSRRCVHQQVQADAVGARARGTSARTSAVARPIGTAGLRSLQAPLGNEGAGFRVPLWQVWTTPEDALP